MRAALPANDIGTLGCFSSSRLYGQWLNSSEGRNSAAAENCGITLPRRDGFYRVTCIVQRKEKTLWCLC